MFTPSRHKKNQSLSKLIKTGHLYNFVLTDNADYLATYIKEADFAGRRIKTNFRI